MSGLIKCIILHWCFQILTFHFGFFGGGNLMKNHGEGSYAEQELGERDLAKREHDLLKRGKGNLAIWAKISNKLRLQFNVGYFKKSTFWTFGIWFLEFLIELEGEPSWKKLCCTRAGRKKFGRARTGLSGKGVKGYLAIPKNISKQKCINNWSAFIECMIKHRLLICGPCRFSKGILRGYSGGILDELLIDYILKFLCCSS